MRRPGSPTIAWHQPWESGRGMAVQEAPSGKLLANGTATMPHLLTLAQRLPRPHAVRAVAATGALALAAVLTACAGSPAGTARPLPPT
jgi:hypothetical protein